MSLLRPRPGPDSSPPPPVPPARPARRRLRWSRLPAVALPGLLVLSMAAGSTGAGPSPSSGRVVEIVVTGGGPGSGPVSR